MMLKFNILAILEIGNPAMIILIIFEAQIVKTGTPCDHVTASPDCYQTLLNRNVLVSYQGSNL